MLKLSTVAKTIQIESTQIKSLTSELVAEEKEIKKKKSQSNQRQERRKQRGREKVEDAH